MREEGKGGKMDENTQTPRLPPCIHAIQVIFFKSVTNIQPQYLPSNIVIARNHPSFPLQSHQVIKRIHYPFFLYLFDGRKNYSQTSSKKTHLNTHNLPSHLKKFSSTFTFTYLYKKIRRFSLLTLIPDILSNPQLVMKTRNLNPFSHL